MWHLLPKVREIIVIGSLSWWWYLFARRRRRKCRLGTRWWCCCPQSRFLADTSPLRCIFGILHLPANLKRVSKSIANDVNSSTHHVINLRHVCDHVTHPNEWNVISDCFVQFSVRLVLGPESRREAFISICRLMTWKRITYFVPLYRLMSSACMTRLQTSRLAFG